MENKKDFKTLIPFFVLRDKSIPSGSKFLYGDIIRLCNKNGFCDITTERFANLSIVSKSVIKRWMDSLVKANLIKFRPKNNILKEIFSKKEKFDNIGIGDKKCNWCGVKTYILHKHHHPISKNKGGEKTIDICPNCHHEFHYHSNSTFELILDKEGLIQLNNLKKYYDKQ